MIRLKFKTDQDARVAYGLLIASGCFQDELLSGCEVECEGSYKDVDWVLHAEWQVDSDDWELSLRDDVVESWSSPLADLEDEEPDLRDKAHEVLDLILDKLQ